MLLFKILAEFFELKPDFMAVSLQHGTVYMKTGEYHETASDFATLLS